MRGGHSFTVKGTLKARKHVRFVLQTVLLFYLRIISRDIVQPSLSLSLELEFFEGPVFPSLGLAYALTVYSP